MRGRHDRRKLDLVADGLKSVGEAAGYLGVSRGFVYGLLRQGVLPSVRLGRCRRIPVASLRELAAARLGTSR